MKTHKNKHLKRALVFVLVTALVSPMFLSFKPAADNATSISIAEICQQSAECQAASKKKAEAEAAAAAASRSANAYQAKVADLTAEIAMKEYEIAETEARIKSLVAEITAAEAKLKSQQDALVELLVNMHFSSDAEPIKILAGASSISDLAEKAAREATAKEQISVAAAKVKQAKEELEFDKAEVEKLLTEQQQAHEQMMATKAEQESLIRKYENDAEAYNQMAQAALKERQDAIRAWQKANPNVFSGSVYDGYNTYPWQEDCPHQQDWYTTRINGTPIGGYVCECVSYAGWKAYEIHGYIIAWGDANTWDDYAREDSRVSAVNNTPDVWTIGQSDNGIYGHVFWVESINADGSINVTEYNNGYATQLYSGVYRDGDFGARTIPASMVGGYNYIHF